MSGGTVVLPPSTIYAYPQPSTGYGFSGGGLGYHYGSGFGFGFDMGGIEGYVRFLASLNQNYFDQSGYKNHHNYVDPASDKYLYDGLVNFALPQLGSISEFFAEAYKSNMSKADFDLLKSQALKGNWAIQVGMAGATVSQDIENGVAPQVTIGTQVVMLTVSALAVGVIGSTLGLPVALASGLILSLGYEFFEVKDILNKALGSLLEHLGLENSVDSDGSVVLTDYDLYRITNELIENPESYPVEAIISELLQAIPNSLPSSDSSSEAPQVQDRDAPVLVDFSNIEAVDGLKSFEAQGQGALLFIGDASDIRMVGGDGLNWFMPVLDTPLGESFSTTAIGGSGYNILDFSLNTQGVDIALSGNDIKNARIETIAEENGWEWYSYFNEENISYLRGSLPIQELQSMSESLWSENIFKNIDMIIGSAYDDILVGDWLGGITMTGGGGNDEFVVHGGNNRIIFMDGDFSDPYSGDVTLKTIHGLLVKSQTDIFNNKYYLPQSQYSQPLKLEPDFLDFSAMDADLTQEGAQSFTYISRQVFSGAPGELRLDPKSDRMVIQGDRTGDGVADFEVEYYFYDIEWAFPVIPGGILIDMENRWL